MSHPIPAHEFRPEPDTSYLLYCPEHGGWHVGEWWEIDGPGRWVLAFDTAHELHPSHVLPAPDDAMDVTEVIRWAWMAGAASRACMMLDDIKLVWLTDRDPHTGKADQKEGIAWDGEVAVGKVRRAAGDPTNRGEWRWSMFAYGRHCREDASVSRAGAAHSKDWAKADCERAYLDLLGMDPGNRQAIRDHHASVQERARLWEAGEGLKRAR